MGEAYFSRLWCLTSTYQACIGYRVMGGPERPSLDQTLALWHKAQHAVHLGCLSLESQKHSRQSEGLSSFYRKSF
jgi:hypothetical protein